MGALVVQCLLYYVLFCTAFGHERYHLVGCYTTKAAVTTVFITDKCRLHWIMAHVSCVSSLLSYMLVKVSMFNYHKTFA